MFLAADEFTSQYKVTVNTFTEADFQVYINKFVQKYLTDLLGVELYNLFIADLVADVPVTQIYLDLYNEFSFDDGVGSGCQHRSEGMIEMLKGFIYFHWLRDQFSQNVISGAVKNDYSNSVQARMVETNMESNFNEAIESYQQIQWYIEDNLDLYPLYNGKKKEAISWL
jgi:hypothetical protein